MGVVGQGFTDYFEIGKIPTSVYEALNSQTETPPKTATGCTVPASGSAQPAEDS